ncbi:MAG: phytanoyl-CoA dioxygenase family protein [Gammaproteobacteria bacterium]|nr:phytanoyl-CoA dioxygenase family protein [Gammaproteobacteria bacterium]
MVGTDQVRQYKEDGYILVEGVLSAAKLHRLREVTDAMVASAAQLTEHSDHIDLEPSHTRETPRVRRIKKPHQAHPFYRELAADRAITDCMAPLIGENIRLRPAGKVNMKSAGFGAPVEWHQDWAFYPHTNQDVLAVGILLDDMTLENGPLMVLPGSHRGEVFDHHADGAFCGAIDVAAAQIKLDDAVPLTAPAGSITIHHARLVHGSKMNTSGAPRRILFYEYTAVDAWPLGGIEPVEDFEEFNSRVVRGQPTVQPRMEFVPVRMPLPKAKHQGSIYENQRTLTNPFFEHDPDKAAAPANVSG